MRAAKYTQNDVKIAVANQIQNMLYNNITLGQGTENFMGWCQDGEVYELLPEATNFGDKFVEDCIALSKKISGSIDTISINLTLE